MNRCKRYNVSAVGWDFKGMVSTTNGNENECSGEIGNCGCIHAEILLLKRMPKPVVVWVSVSPCIDCAIALVKSGVKFVQYEKQYRKTEGIEYLSKCGVLVERLFGDERGFLKG